MDELKMSIEEMISTLDAAAGRLIVASLGNTTIKEAMEMVTNVSISLGEWATDGLPQNRWIPVTERLPEAKVDVLAVVRYKDGTSGVNQGWYSVLNEQWYIGLAGIHATVTHWMPLPDAPEEEHNG